MLKLNRDSLRQILGDYILSMIRRINFTDETMNISWVKSEALPTLAFLAYCKNKFNIKPELSEKSRTVFRNRLVSAFAHLMSHSQGFVYPCDLLLDHNLTPDAIPMDGRISAAGDEGRRTMKIAYKKARKSTDREKKLWESLSLLYSLVIFQLYNGEADAVNLLSELKLCCDALIERSGRIEFGAEASVVLVEILLSLVSKPSALFRKVAEQVFTAFCNDFTEHSIRLMTDVLGSKENLKGQEELFDRDEQDDEQDGEQDEEQDGEQDGEEDESVDLDSDVELVSANKYLESGGDEDESEDGENNEGEEEGSEEALQKLDDELAKALGTHPAHQDINAESSDDDTDMTDSEMMTLDAKLVEIFSQRKKAPNKKEKKGAKENIINFRNRVLDLLEI
jgi:DNA polymerase phi